MVFSALQLSWFSVEQAWAVTEDQWAELNAEQKLAVQRARYEGDILLELRGVHTKIYIVPLHCVHMQHILSVIFCFSFEVVFFMCSIKVSNSCLPPTPPGRNSAAALLIAECFPVHLLALCLCLWHIV